MAAKGIELKAILKSYLCHFLEKNYKLNMASCNIASISLLQTAMTVGTLVEHTRITSHLEHLVIGGNRIKLTLFVFVNFKQQI